jgi:D-glycero-D-manno-heptose 1,7-bisphosphate phosphatase
MQGLNCCLFLDRDGTINIEKDFIKDPNDLQLIPGAAEAIREARELGLKVIVISNQSGIARKILTEIDVHKVNMRLIELLSEAGASVDAIYYCPHNTVGETECSCRKPNTGLFEKARNEHNINFNCCIMVGDKLSDIEAGKRIGAKTVLVLTGYGSTLKGNWRKKPDTIDFVAADLYDSMNYIRKLVRTWKTN